MMLLAIDAWVNIPLGGSCMIITKHQNRNMTQFLRCGCTCAISLKVVYTSFVGKSNAHSSLGGDVNECLENVKMPRDLHIPRFCQEWSLVLFCWAICFVCYTPYTSVVSSSDKFYWLVYCLRSKSWKPECVLSFNMGWRILVNLSFDMGWGILVFYREPKARDNIY